MAMSLYQICFGRAVLLMQIVLLSIASPGGGGPDGAAKTAKIYVYDLPAGCSFDDYPGSIVDDTLKPNPPVTPIHRAIVESDYIVADPTVADLFYIPAPFLMWSNSYQCSADALKAKPPFFTDPQRHHFNGGLGMALPEVAFRLKGNGRWAISVWVRASLGTADGRVVIVSTNVQGGRSLDVGLVDGCPALLTCDGEREHVANSCKQRLDDGSWHYISSVYDGSKSTLIVNNTVVGSMSIGLNIGFGLAYYGHRAEKVSDVACKSEARGFKGEAQGLQVFDYAVSQDLLVYKFGGPLTSGNPCWQQVKDVVEKSSSFRRNNGWDHFVVQGSMDYPACFTFEHENSEEHYELERDWPAFGRFSMLHLGARAEICAASRFGDPKRNTVPQAAPSCWRRYFRMITIPPVLEGETFDCKEMAKRKHAPRPIRISYRGLAYSAMFERTAVATITKSPVLTGLQYTGQVMLEFTNWTHESVRNGQCRDSAAFERLCPWKARGRGYVAQFGYDRKVNMKKRSLQLWAKSRFCLVMPGDGGYELRLFSMINLGCIPVIIYTSARTLPKVPFAASLPWSEFAIFWDINHANIDLNDAHYGTQAPGRTAMQLMLQLLAVDETVIDAKRAALARAAPSLGWRQSPGCDYPTALDLVVQELLHRARMPEPAASGHVNWLKKRDWSQKLPVDAMRDAPNEDLNGNGCRAGYPICESHINDVSGDVCHSFSPGVGHTCPIGCYSVGPNPYCVAGERPPLARRRNGTDVLVSPCRNPLCGKPVQIIEPVVDKDGLPADKSRLRILIVSFSTRPQLRKLTWPSLQRFADAHEDRYQLELNTEPLLDVRDYHPAWNKLAFVRRGFAMGNYHAVVWIDDDILITRPEVDPIFEHLVSNLLNDDHKIVLASLDDTTSERVPLNSGILGFKRGYAQQHMIKELFKIGTPGKAYMIGDQWTQPSHLGFWDQDAFAIYAQRHGTKAFATVPHRVLQSFVRQKGAGVKFVSGDFAAHFTGIRRYDLLIETVLTFMAENKIPLEA